MPIKAGPLPCLYNFPPPCKETSSQLVETWHYLVDSQVHNVCNVPSSLLKNPQVYSRNISLHSKLTSPLSKLPTELNMDMKELAGLHYTCFLRYQPEMKGKFRSTTQGMTPCPEGYLYLRLHTILSLHGPFPLFTHTKKESNL